MALLALIVNQPSLTTPTQISVHVQFYDDTDPDNAGSPKQFLEEVNMPFVSTATAAEIQAAVIARGQDLAATVAKLASIRSTIKTPRTIVCSP